jgi:hypothetical protein
VYILFFDDYSITGLVYHVAPINELEEILKTGLKNGESCSESYRDFNRYFDMLKPWHIPEWVCRENAIYGSLNFKTHNTWHSHSAILSLKIDEARCWIGNENLANKLYEPFIFWMGGLSESASRLMTCRGKDLVLDYWNCSRSFKLNLVRRKDELPQYDAEVLIMHDIPPEDIGLLKIVSDHKIMDFNEWEKTFSKM